MSSGHGIAGGVGRCYPFFAEFKECLVSGMCCEFSDVLLCMMFVLASLLHVSQRRSSSSWGQLLIAGRMF